MTEPVWTLAITRGHNGATTLFKDNEMIFYVEEERLTRQKYDGSPLAGIIKATEYTDVIHELILCHTYEHAPQLDWTGEDVYQGLLRKMGYSGFRTTNLGSAHHLTHAACAFYNSGFDSAVAVIVDGAGSVLGIDEKGNAGYEFESIFDCAYPSQFDLVYKRIGTNDVVAKRPLKEDLDIEITVSENPGITKTYEAATEYCGFGFIEAGKTMGLSPYGKEDDNIPDFIINGEGNRSLLRPMYPGGALINETFYDYLKRKPQDGKDVWTKKQKNVAWKVQRQTEKAMIDLIQKAIDKTGQKNIVIAGGFGLNCVANYKYKQHFGDDVNIYVEPISHDGGTSIGAAKFAYHTRTKSRDKNPLTSLYLGPQYDPETYEVELNKHDDVEVTEVTKADVANLIAEGNIVTMFQGRSEAGPRALGNRSILFDPTVKDGKDIVNEVKHREFFRPFAGTVLKEYVHDWFDLAGMDETPYMMYAVDVKEDKLDVIPSITHVDGTCRIQTVTREQNENYYELIEEFKKIKDVPILFNTSFNLGGEPLVETIEDAVRTIQNSDLNYLYLPEIGKLVKCETNLRATEEESDED
jgi:carbamoyltransferase